MIERIVGVALRRPSGLTISLPAPARHGHVIEWLSETGHGGKWTLECEQGFSTDRREFVDRVEALALAKASGQFRSPSGRADDPELYSEDMW